MDEKNLSLDVFSLLVATQPQPHVNECVVTFSPLTKSKGFDVLHSKRTHRLHFFGISLYIKMKMLINFPISLLPGRAMLSRVSCQGLPTLKIASHDAV